MDGLNSENEFLPRDYNLNLQATRLDHLLSISAVNRLTILFLLWSNPQTDVSPVYGVAAEGKQTECDCLHKVIEKLFK